MNKFYLPKIKSISISNYSLYKCPFIIDFSSKLNIIFGTNGIGKSTLLMIILFSIIGPYRGGIKTKVRQDQRKDNRPIYTDDFFRNRMVNIEEDAFIKAEFIINEDFYVVTHSLYDGRLLSVKFNGTYLEGKNISYRTFESKFTRARDMSDDNFNDNELKEYLIYSYQKCIKDSTKLPGGVNTLISMLLDVMFFDEGRNLTFWNADLQETVIGKYIVDADFYENYCERKLDTKALESTYKKKSETHNFMNKFFENEKKEVKGNKEEIDVVALNVKLVRLEDEIISLEKNMNELQKQYKKTNERLFELLKNIESLKENINNLEKKWYSNLFPKKYDIYYSRFSNKMMEGICPICGASHNFNISTSNCILCSEKLAISQTTDLVALDIERRNHQILLKQRTSERDNLRKNLNCIKEKISKIKINYDEKNIEKEEVEVMLNVKREDEEDNDSKRLKKAREERDQALYDFNASKEIEEEMRKTIEHSLVSNFKEFSSIFHKYATSFFGNNHKIELSLPFNNYENSFEELMIRFNLDGKDRTESFMLSESQRIFTDLSFRFTILTAFHNESFFICETPDSTLDMYHEENAVNTFKEYIKMGNSLILTANIRKSNLISKLCSEYSKDEINIIDLTKISKLSLPIDISFESYIEVTN